MKAKILTPLVTLALVGAMAAAPLTSYADGYHRHEASQRNQWNGFALGSAILGLIGVAAHNDGLAVAGGLGAVYSEYRASTISRDRGRGDRNYRDDWGYQVRRDRRF